MTGGGRPWYTGTHSKGVVGTNGCGLVNILEKMPLLAGPGMTRLICPGGR